MIAKVTNCDNCPFKNSDMDDGDSCNHPMNKVDIICTTWQQEVVPDNCPLRNGDIIVTIKN